MGSNDKLKYVTSFKDRHGRWWFYFRYHHKKYKLPGKPGEAAFHDAYARFLAALESGAIGRDERIAWLLTRPQSDQAGPPAIRKQEATG